MYPFNILIYRLAERPFKKILTKRRTLMCVAVKSLKYFKDKQTLTIKGLMNFD